MATHWAVTHLAHGRRCDRCSDLALNAATTASKRGIPSVTETRRDQRVGDLVVVEHSATVIQVLDTITLNGPS